MQIQQIRNPLKFVATILGITLVGLTSAVIAGEPLEQRAQRYWTARAVNDLQTVYSLESAALPGGGLTPDQYQRVKGLPVRDVKVLETVVEGDRAKVKIQGQVAVGTLGWVSQSLTEEWVLVNDEWYHSTPKP